MSTGPPQPPPEGRESGRALPNLILAATLVALSLLIMATALSVYAIFTGTTSVTPNDFATDTLNPPTSLTATSGASVNLSWTATANTYASGHRVLRGTATGGPYTQIAEVTPRTTTTYIDSPAAGTYYYVARAFYQSWESVNSNEASAVVGTPASTGFLSCAANAAVTTGSGDNTGFQLNPANACANDAAFAEDTNSGNTNATTCSDVGKDRHLYYNYGFSIPVGSSISGIEVRLDAWADSTAASPFMCVELSWDGGTTWTAAKTTTTLGAAEATFTLGTTTDNWSRTWSPTEFSDANFRVRITDVASNVQRDFRLDWAAVQVSYIAP